MTDDTSDLPPLDTGAEQDKFPLPPADVVDQMLRQEVPAAPTTGTATAVLQFRGIREKSVPLEFDFDYEGRHVTEIVVRRLSTAELGAVVDRLGASFTQWDLFEVMTGFPAAVLRALDSVDGAEVTEVAHAFLPRRLRG
jgi:hypothetical protein